MAYAALQELFRTQSQLVAATCEELVADHGAIAAAVAFFFRHETPGRLPKPVAIGDQIANAPPPPADAPAPNPLIPMVLIGKTRHCRNAKTS